jgi:hypothetical protein
LLVGAEAKDKVNQKEKFYCRDNILLGESFDDENILLAVSVARANTNTKSQSEELHS